MEKSDKNRDELPQSFASIDELQDFWDEHSSADYEDLMEDVDVEVVVGSPSKVYCAVERGLIGRVHSLAEQMGVPTETLLERWIEEKLAAA